jgi:hypothetical protein
MLILQPSAVLHSGTDLPKLAQSADGGKGFTISQSQIPISLWLKSVLYQHVAFTALCDCRYGRHEQNCADDCEESRHRDQSAESVSGPIADLGSGSIVDPMFQASIENFHDSLLENYWRPGVCSSTNHETSTRAGLAVNSLQALREPWQHSGSASLGAASDLRPPRSVGLS